MPTTYAHYRFGNEVLHTLPKPLKESIKKNKELFDIGVHGPDVLFYYKALTKNRVNQLGYEMHERTADEFFIRAAEVLKRVSDPAAARVYIYGFICHFALDSECHKYIEKIIQVSGISHDEIETEFDRYLMVEDGLDLVRHNRTGHIHPTMKNAQVIAPFFEDITAPEVQRSLQSQIFYHRLLKAGSPARSRFLFGIMKLTGSYDSKHGLVMNTAANPKCEDYCVLLKKLFLGAVPLAAGLILQYQKKLFNDSMLPVRFQETFGAGNEWEKLLL